MVVRITIDANQTKLLTNMLMITTSKNIKATGINYFYLHITSRKDPETSRKAISRNNMGIFKIKSIYQIRAPDGGVFCFIDENYLSVGGHNEAGQVLHLDTVKAPAYALTIPRQ